MYSQNCIKIAHINKFTDGGAYIATETLSNGLINLGYQSHVYTADFDQGSRAWELRKQGNQLLESYIAKQIYAGNMLMSLFNYSLPLGDLRNLVTDHDIIHLHWLPGLVSNEGVAFFSQLCAEQGKPLLYTTHDMHALSGGCHCFHGCQRWQTDCCECPQLRSSHWNDVPAKILSAKKKYWNLQAITVVSPSQHLAKNIISHSIFSGSRIEVVPNSVNLEIFSPQDSRQARNMLQLPQNVILIAFLPLYGSRIKGMEEAVQVYRYLEDREPSKYHWAITSPAYSSFDIKSNNIHRIGLLQKREDCALLYSAVDLTLVPSSEEVFPNTTAESLACGTPVIGFQISGLVDMISDGYNGYTVKLGDCEAMASAIQKLISGTDLSQNCHKYAKENLAPAIQAAKMDDVYQSLLRELKPQNGDNSSKIPIRFPKQEECYEECYQEAIREYYLERSPWYRFGQQSLKGKVKMILLALFKRFKKLL